MFIKRVINLREDIEVEVVIIVRILLLIVIDKTSFIYFESIRFNNVLRGTRIELNRLLTLFFIIVISFL